MRRTVLILSLILAIACRADEILVGPVAMRVGLADSLLAPDHPLRLTGDVRDIRVRIGGLPARILQHGDSFVVVEVPDSLFAPCLREGVRYEADIRRGRQRLVLSLPAASVPFRLHLAAGEHAFASDAVERGCAVELPDSGLYLAMPFTWDRPGTDSAPEAPLLARVVITPVSRPGGSPPRPSPARPLPRRVYGPDAVPEAEVVKLGAPWLGGPAAAPAEESLAATAAPACPAMPDVGDSVAVPTDRSRGGVFAGFQGLRRSEYWRVVGTSTHLLVLFDARTLARARQDPNARRRLLNFLGDYESLVAPFLARALSHWENHARIPVLMTDTTVSRAHGSPIPGRTWCWVALAGWPTAVPSG